MKAVFAIVALLAAAQLASAGGENSYASKSYAVYTPAPAPATKVTYVPEVVIVNKTVTDVCITKLVAITAPVVFVCPTGYTSDANGKCAASKQVCEQPKVQYKVKQPVYVAKGSYGRKLQGSDNKGSYAPTKVQYVAPKVQYVPKAPVCKTVTVYAQPIATCAKGTLSGHVCILGTQAGPCPTGFTPDSKDSTHCVRVTIVQEKQVVQKQVVVEVAKPKYVKQPVYVAKTPAVSYSKTPAPASYTPAPAVYGRRLNGVVEDLIGKIAGKVHKVLAKVESKKPAYKPHPTPAPQYPYCQDKYASLY